MMMKDTRGKAADGLIDLVMVFYMMRNRHAAGGVKPPPYDPQYWILGFLMREDLPISEIGRRLMRSKPNMTALAGKLLREGKVRRVPDRKDRRVVRLSITRRGRMFLMMKKKMIRKSMIDNLSGLDGMELEELRSSLARVNRIIKRLD
jgi:DNA-binding MarR family transcriptional regulator